VKAVVNVTISLTKPEITGSDFEAIKDWVKTNIMDKLPPNASAIYTLTISS